MMVGQVRSNAGVIGQHNLSQRLVERRCRLGYEYVERVCLYYNTLLLVLNL